MCSVYIGYIPTYIVNSVYTIHSIFMYTYIYDLYYNIIIVTHYHISSYPSAQCMYIYLCIITCRRGRACHLLRLLQVINEWLRSQTIILSAQAPPPHPYVPTLICGGVERRRRIRLKKKKSCSPHFTTPESLQNTIQYLQYYMRVNDPIQIPHPHDLLSMAIQRYACVFSYNIIIIIYISICIVCIRTRTHNNNIIISCGLYLPVYMLTAVSTKYIIGQDKRPMTANNIDHCVSLLLINILYIIITIITIILYYCNNLS